MDPTGQRRRSPARRGRVRRQRRALAVAAFLIAAVVAGALALSRDDDGPRRIPVAPIGERLPPPPPPPEPRESAATEPVSIAAVGDIMMGSSDHGLPSDGGAGTFASVTGLLEGDIVFGNLEGPLTDAGGSKCGADSTSCFAFRTPPSYAAHLAAAGFDVMSVANNHAFDFGAQGLADTLEALSGAGIEATGSVGTTAVMEANGTLVGFVGFAPYEWADPLLDLDEAADRVTEAAAEADVVVVTMHGGAEGTDAQHVPEGPESYLGEQRGDMRAFARATIDAGADLVIGHGPHVLRGLELYKDRLVVYSLGNFVGYEAFSLNGPLSTSAVLQVRVAADGRFMDGRLRPVQLVGAGRPAPGGGAIAMVDALSAEDFGGRAVRLSPDGAMRAPAGDPAP